MNEKELRKVWRGRIRPLMEELLNVKGSEYVSGDDRLVNFADSASLQKETLDEALFGMVSKQIVSWADYTRRVAGGEDIPYEKWEEKLCDVMVYAFLHLCIRLEAEAMGPLMSSSQGSGEMP